MDQFFLSLAVNGCVSSMIPNTRLVLPLLKGTFSFARKCNEPFRPTTMFEFFADWSCVILAIRLLRSHLVQQQHRGTHWFCRSPYMDLFLSLVENGCVSSMTPMHAARVAFGVAHARRSIALSHRCNDLVLRPTGGFHISVHHVFSHAGNAGNECADIPAFLGMKGFISESNVPSFWPTRLFYVQRLLNAPQCLSRVAEMFTQFSCSDSARVVFVPSSWIEEVLIRCLILLSAQRRLCVHFPFFAFRDDREPLLGFSASAASVQTQ